MESRSHRRGRVKGLGLEFPGKITRKRPDKRTTILFIRILGYLLGVWEKGQGNTKYFFWDKHRFSRKSMQPGGIHPGYSVKHLERMFPRFQVWCTQFQFERVRLGRSWRIKVTPNLGVRGPVKGSEIHARLKGAIEKMADLAGVAHVDREFLRKFCAISRLPREAVAIIWAQLRPLPGYRCRWRGKGSGRKFVVFRLSQNFTPSHPRSSRGISSPTGRREEKQSAASASGQASQADRALAPLATGRSGGESSWGIRPGGNGPPAQVSDRLPPEEIEAAHDPTGPPTREKSKTRRGFHRAKTVLEPLQICGRFVSRYRLLAKAAWVAYGPCQEIHAEFDRVVWRFPHPRNFAFFALCKGFAADVVIAAWRSGVRESHEDALDVDRLPGGGYLSQREPSAAQVYAWRELQRDQRTDEERWREFFAQPYTPAPRRSAAEPAAEETRTRKPQERETRARLHDLRAATAPPTPLESRWAIEAEGAGAWKHVTIEKALASRGLSVAQFMALPRRERDAITRGIIARA